MNEIFAVSSNSWGFDDDLDWRLWALRLILAILDLLKG